MLVCGVGGQGTISLGRVLSLAGLFEPSVVDVVGSETRGVAQREGVTSAVIRWILDGELEFISNAVQAGTVDLVLSLEVIETFRHAYLYSKRTTIVSDTRRILPKTVSRAEDAAYPPNVTLLARLRESFPSTHLLRAHSTSEEHFGDYRQTGLVMLGAMTADDSPVELPVCFRSLEKAVATLFGGREAPSTALELGAELGWGRLELVPQL
ncbi:MAG: 2-oxoacid:acceptor oxidoreductase family protein [Promethearchaeota archaeon]